MSKKATSFKKLITQFFKFGIVGISNTLISLAAYYILVYFGINYLIANGVGFILSVLNSVFWNSKCVFKDKEEHNVFHAFGKVFISYGISFLLSSVLMYLFVQIFHMSKYLAPILRLVFTIPLNFLMNKLWAFKEKIK